MPNRDPSTHSGLGPGQCSDMEFWGEAMALRPSGAPVSVLQAPDHIYPTAGSSIHPSSLSGSGDHQLNREMSLRAQCLAFPLPDVSPAFTRRKISKSTDPGSNPCSVSNLLCEASTLASCGTQKHSLKVSGDCGSRFSGLSARRSQSLTKSFPPENTEGALKKGLSFKPCNQRHFIKSLPALVT